MIANKLLRPIFSYVVPYAQQQKQLKPYQVIPVVLECVATCIVIPEMREMPGPVLSMFEWIGTRMSSWLVALCTGIPSDIKSEKDAHGGGADRAKARLLKELLSVLEDCITEYIDEIAGGLSVTTQPDKSFQEAYVNIINTLVTVLGDSRLQVSAKVINSLYLLCFRVSGAMSARGNQGVWVWKVNGGNWFLGVLQSIFRHIVNNMTFRFETNDLTFYYSDKACTSSYREDIQNYRQKNKTGELLLVAHEMLEQVDLAQKRNNIWTVSYLCSDIEKVARTLSNRNVDSSARKMALIRLEACVWAFGELSGDQVVRTKCTHQVLSTLRLLCQIPFSAIVTTISAVFLSKYRDMLDSGTLDDVKAVVSFVLNQCIAGGENDHTVKTWDFRLQLTRTLRDIAMCQSTKVIEVLRSQAIRPMAQFADTRLKPPKMLHNDTKVDSDHYGIKFDTDGEQEYATLALRLRGRLAQGFVQLAVERASSAGPGGLVRGGHNLIRWVLYPVLSRLDKWIETGNRAFLCGLSGELYILHMAMLPLQSTCSLSSHPGECKGPAISIDFPGVPKTDKPIIPELCFAILSMTRSIYKKHMTSPNIVRHILKLFERVVHMTLKDVTSIPQPGKKFLADVVEMTSLLYANTSAGQETAFHLLKRISSALLGMTNVKDKGTPDLVNVQRSIQDMGERYNFVYQIASGMCLIGEMCVQALPKVKPNTKNVPMGAVAVSRLRYYFDFLGHIISVCPQLFYLGLPQTQKPQPALIERFYMVLSIVLLSAEKKSVIKAALTVFNKLAAECRPQFAQVVANMFNDKLPHLLPPMLWIIVKINSGDVEDSDGKSNIVMLTANVMAGLSHNYSKIFANSISGVVRNMLQGSSSPETAQRWIARFLGCNDAQSFKTCVKDFVNTWFSQTK